MNAHKVAWFVGASFGGTKDQTARFLADGIWEVSNPDEKESALVHSMQPGERIAIKARYTRKNDLPFDNQGRTVSVMSIKAVGTILSNSQDGKRVQVQWQPIEPMREWYFYTFRATIWRVVPGEWKNDALIAFAFEGKQQDIEHFLEESSLRKHFDFSLPEKQDFQWTDFYKAVAEKLLAYQNDRSQLIKGIRDIISREPNFSYLQEKSPDGSNRHLEDIDPFTVMGTFNRQMTIQNRRKIAGELATLLAITVPVPSSFNGIPRLNPQNSRFYASDEKRGPGDIDAMWQLFVAASHLADDDNPTIREKFVNAYDNVVQISGLSWGISTGLYRAHPWEFPTLDSISREFIEKQLGLEIISEKGRCCDAHNYLKLRDDLRSRFGEKHYPVHSFPELSHTAWVNKDSSFEAMTADDVDEGSAKDQVSDNTPIELFKDAQPFVTYTVDEILNDGCFLERAEIDRLIDLFRTKKNLILQGPPGTGKTWLAKRLAFALIGKKDNSKVRAVQFHPNLSYEDFVRGWRPTGDGKLSLAEGIFMEAIKSALKDPLSRFVVVIEEINRGNPAQIFGELLTLLEAGKRTSNEALELCYPDADGVHRAVHIPENLYVIGTMNTADRSIALVDLALRRRFAFVTLEPQLGEVWRDWVIKECNVDSAMVADIERRFTMLNERIAGDPRLGKQFRIGHSYVTPVHRLKVEETRKWFKQVVETEIGPLLEEYWFDAPKAAEDACKDLSEDW